MKSVMGFDSSFVWTNFVFGREEMIVNYNSSTGCIKALCGGVACCEHRSREDKVQY